MGERSYSRPNQGTRVYVGGLTDVVTKEDLKTEFERYGKLNSVWVALNPSGFAFIEFAEKEDAEAACDGMNNTQFLGSTLRVEMSRARRQGGGGRGMRGGSGGQSYHQGGPRGQYPSNSSYPRSRSPFRSTRGYGAERGGFSRNRNDNSGFNRRSYGNSSF